ncbi:MAG: hypothetical protein CMF50_08885 [Legionellales bacterium]|nr:hypothetical protein [Legionellales bacterium]|tara:strand:- start:13654 stop:14298 length:645 start_codon:yes stop_codon:yes gene_type:complete
MAKRHTQSNASAVKKTSTPFVTERETIIGTYNPSREGDYHGRFQANRLYTMNLQTCVAVVIYNSNNKTGAISHFSSGDHVDLTLAGIMRQKEFSDDREHLRVTIVGGTSRLDACFNASEIWQAAYDFFDGIQLDYEHQHWSYSAFYVNTYNILLKLEDEAVEVKNSAALGRTQVIRFFRTLQATTEDSERSTKLRDPSYTHDMRAPMSGMYRLT